MTEVVPSKWENYIFIAYIQIRKVTFQRNLFMRIIGSLLLTIISAYLLHQVFSNRHSGWNLLILGFLLLLAITSSVLNYFTINKVVVKSRRTALRIMLLIGILVTVIISFIEPENNNTNIPRRYFDSSSNDH